MEQPDNGAIICVLNLLLINHWLYSHVAKRCKYSETIPDWAFLTFELQQRKNNIQGVICDPVLSPNTRLED